MRITLVTPTIDSSANYIDEALSSVECPAGVEIEHIVVHDGSAAFTRNLSARYPHLKFIAGKGKGDTAAAAQGFAAATGDFILQLNSDDRLAPGAIARLAERTQARPDIRIWTGGTRMFAAGAGGAEETVRVIAGRKVTALNLANVFDDMPGILSRFIHRSVIAQIGSVDPAFTAASDREFMIRLAMARIPEDYLGLVVAELRMHAGSGTFHRRSGELPPYLAVHIRLADAWLARPDLPAWARPRFRRWRARELLRLAVYQWRSGRRGEAARTIVRELGARPFWPIDAMSAAAGWWRRRRKPT